jgi:hypothetical protein
MAEPLDLDYGIKLDASNNNQNHAADINRYLGGYNRQVDSHPYVKGYFYVFFGFPAYLFPGGNENVKEISQEKALIYTLSAAEGFTPPGDRQLKVEDIQGQGGVDSSFITGQTIDRNFSVQYRDFWGAPLFRVHRQWTEYFNPYYGGHAGGGLLGNSSMYSALEYKGTCMVIQTKPITKQVGEAWAEQDIIKVDWFDGVIPITDLKSAYDANITDNSFVKPTVQYRFDGFPLDESHPDVMHKALQILKSVDYSRHNSSAAIYEDLIMDNNISQVRGINYGNID